MVLIYSKVADVSTVKSKVCIDVLKVKFSLLLLSFFIVVEIFIGNIKLAINATLLIGKSVHCTLLIGNPFDAA